MTDILELFVTEAQPRPARFVEIITDFKILFSNTATPFLIFWPKCGQEISLDSPLLREHHLKDYQSWVSENWNKPRI